MAQPDSGTASLALALAGGGAGGLVAAEAALRSAVALPECDVPRWHLKLTLARLMVRQDDLTQRPEMFEEALALAVEVILEAPTDPAPYFVAGLAEFNLAEGETSIYLRPWRRHRARTYLRQCSRLDSTHVEARRTAVLVSMWIALFRGAPKIDSTMLVVLTPIMIGLVALSVGQDRSPISQGPTGRPSRRR